MMKNISEDQQTLMLIFRHVGMPTKEGAAAMVLISKHNLEREMVDWLIKNPKASADAILTALLLKIKKIKKRE